MKVSQILKLSAVVVALGVMPFHAAFAHESGEANSEQSTGVNSGDTQSENGETNE